MIYAYKENSRWVFPVSMRSRFNGVGGWHTLTDEQRAEYGWYLFEPTNYSYNPNTQNRFGPFNVRLEGIILKADYQVVDKSVEDLRQAMIERLAQVRYDREVIGVYVNGIYITTGDRSKLLINGKVNRALISQQMGDTNWSCQWKIGSNTYINLNAQQIIGIGMAIDSYVQACFDNEATLADQIANSNDPLSIDLDSGWPDINITM